MNEKLEQFFKENESIKKAAELKARNRHLVSLGLTDASKGSFREYNDTFDSYFNKYDEKLDKYYHQVGDGAQVAIDVTDEEYAKICEYDKTEEVNYDSINLEKIAKNTSTIKGILIFFTVLFIISVFIFFVSGLFSAPVRY